jgi:hypothetical protein
MKNILIRSLLALAVTTSSLGISSCVNDLDREPEFDPTSAIVYNDPANYEAILAKLYSGLAVSGQQGPSGAPDLRGFDEGTSPYLRMYWFTQQLPTDEAIIAWNDGDLPELNRLTWTPSNTFVRTMYNRLFYQVTVCNEFIRETTDAKLSSRGVTGTTETNVKQYRAEARFLRALSYFHALDMFGNVPFVTENDPVGAFLPKQTTRAELFNYVESELLAIEPEMVAARQNQYGRADRGAVQTLLAKLYLNAQVYTGQAKFTEAATYAKRVIDSGYALTPVYNNLFVADNNIVAASEIIFPITFDGLRTKTFGGMTFLVHAGVNNGTMDPAAYGINGGWSGFRAKSTLADKFTDLTGASDDRARNFVTEGHRRENNDIFTFTDGFGLQKYRNVTSTGVKGSDTSGDHPDTDFPMFRLADVYLMYAEAVVRGGAGSSAEALTYVNRVRQRSKASTINASQLTLDFLLDERARELHMECYRRTDLIRFGRFAGPNANYVWPWKGGVLQGQPVAESRNLYPIPSSDLTANPTLVQNPGY